MLSHYRVKLYVSIKVYWIYGETVIRYLTAPASVGLLNTYRRMPLYSAKSVISSAPITEIVPRDKNFASMFVSPVLRDP